jgi:hypothetical protein
MEDGVICRDVAAIDTHDIDDTLRPTAARDP